jgi:AraC family transcriptional regulator of adaptative response / DNA-3-methyladenine glycosylase II
MARDERFDGIFFIGVSSTLIYCRPSCPAKRPKKENCIFFQTAAQAQKAGYRPCRLCRPDLDLKEVRASSSAPLAKLAAKLMIEEGKSIESVGDIARRLGCDERRLHRAFTKNYQIPAVKFLTNCRLIEAKNLLTSSCTSIAQAAMAAGFGSLRRFNHIFKKSFNLRPAEMRERKSRKKFSDFLEVAISYRPPYDWASVIKFFSTRAIVGVEWVTTEEYFRTVSIKAEDGKMAEGWLSVKNNPSKNLALVRLSETLWPVLDEVLKRVKRQFDFALDPYAVYETLSVMNQSFPNVCVLGARLPGSFEVFETAVRAVIGQQISLKAAGTLAARIAEKFGRPIETDLPGLTRIFPSPIEILALDAKIEDLFGPLGLISSRSITIGELARLIERKGIDFEYGRRPEEEIKKLIKIPGVGSWTANYLAMRTMGYTDALMETDLGLKKATQPYSAKQLFQLAENWRPWRSYAMINLWNRL